MKKIKNFVCTPIHEGELSRIESEINSFTKTCNVLDIKIEAAQNIIVYAVIYEDNYVPRSDENE